MTESRAGIELLGFSDAAAALRAAGEQARGFLGLDPVTQNDEHLARELAAAEAVVLRDGATVLGYRLNPAQPRQALVSSTSADPVPLRALLEFVRSYRRCTTFAAEIPAGAESGAAFESSGFERTGILRGHRFHAGAYHDVLLYFAREEEPCGT